MEKVVEQKRGRGRPPKIVNASDSVNRLTAQEVNEVDVIKKIRTSVGSGIRHIATDQNKEIVRKYASLGASHAEIAKKLNISDDTLYKYYSVVLDDARTEANSVIAGALFQKAVSGDTIAMIFWLKTRARWKEFKEEDFQQKNEIKISWSND